MLRLAPHFDVIAENGRAGAMDRLGLGYADIAAVHPGAIYVSVSGFGHDDASPYLDWPAYAPVVEAMSGIYERQRPDGQPPTVAPVGAFGDIGAALFATIGVLAALRHREATGEGQHVDVAMLDAVVAMTDIVMNFWSMGAEVSSRPALIMHGFQAADGWFVLQVGREEQFARLARLVGRPDWLDDDRLVTRAGWVAHLDDVLRPAIEAMGGHPHPARGLLATSPPPASPPAPCFRDDELAADPHVQARDMAVAVPRPDGSGPPVLVPGNPVHLSKVARGPERRVPWLGEHTDDLLAAELGLTASEIDELRAEKVIA